MSINLIDKHCQAVPDRDRGVVFGLDISKDTITYRAYRPESSSKAFTVRQDMFGFRKIEAALEEFRDEEVKYGLVTSRLDRTAVAFLSIWWTMAGESFRSTLSTPASSTR